MPHSLSAVEKYRKLKVEGWMMGKDAVQAPEDATIVQGTCTDASTKGATLGCYNQVSATGDWDGLPTSPSHVI